MAKIENFKFDTNIHSALKKHFLERVTPQQIIDDYEFYMEVFRYIKKNELAIQSAQIAAMLDYIFHFYYNNRNAFHLNNISLQRLFNEIEQWLRILRERNYYSTLGVATSICNGLNIDNLHAEIADNRYSIIHLKSAEELYLEGKEMSHCVFSYISYCISGSYSIWLLRIAKGKQSKRLASIEVRHNAIVQVRKKSNGLPGKLERQIIDMWVDKTGLKKNFLV